ncbi:unnamed protein product [Pieris macdunnoughi]|uniref:Peptidase S1 domain-containing protein n=1 Tax=Pieris macdunnoughi TaxID=345717 RepID=A0A821LFK9_9NEOP|nr:unnamed protein product [Pieris macdunnoughi]
MFSIRRSCTGHIRVCFSALLAVGNDGREPFKARVGSLPFLVYFTSRYRGICVGTLLSRTTVITAAVCVTNPNTHIHDYRPINVITGTSYRHPRRGIRVQVTKVLMPKCINDSATIGYTVQQSPAVLVLKRKIPDVLVEIPLRPINIDYKGEEILSLHEECIMAGWHFFYKGDKIYPVSKFLLQRNTRVQFLEIARKNVWCDTLTLKFQKALLNIGYKGVFDKSYSVCIRDTDQIAQPCHGMYGAPLICRGKLVGLLMAPDAQWSNCTGYSNLIHLFNSEHTLSFMKCVSRMFEPEFDLSWDGLKTSLQLSEYEKEYDYIPAMYDRVLGDSSTSSEEVI